MTAESHSSAAGDLASNGALLAPLLRALVYATLLSMPFSAFLPLAPPLLSNVVLLYVTPGIELADIPAFLLLQLAAGRRILHPTSTRSSPSSTALAGLLALVPLTLALLAFAGAFDALIPRLAVYSACRWLFAAGVFWGIRQAAVPPQRVAVVLGLGLCLHVIVALLQVLHGAPLGLPGELALPADAHGAPVLHLGEHVLLRGYGLTFHPNVLGGYLAVALVLLLPLARRLAAQCLIVFLTLGLALTLSRSAVLAFVAAGGPMLWWLSRQDPEYRRIARHALLAASCLVLVTLPLWWKPITARLQPLGLLLGLSAAGTPSAIAEKQALWARNEMNRMAWQAFLRHPLLGVGAGNFPALMLAENSRLLPQYVHNVPLLLAAEVGIFGLAAWLWIPIAATLRLWRDRRGPWLVAGCAAAGIITIIGMFDCYPWSLQAGRLLTVTVLALIAPGRGQLAA
jgi:O-antigen ligase